MTQTEFLNKRELVLGYCPRGTIYFCDGSPNLSADGDVPRCNIGVCEHRVQGVCTYLPRFDVPKKRGRKCLEH